MPKNIPVSAAREVARAYDCRQVILLAWDGFRTHVVTYGDTIEACDQAAAGGNRVKKALGWTDDSCNAEPPRVKKLKEENAKLRAALAKIAQPSKDPAYMGVAMTLHYDMAGWAKAALDAADAK